MNEVSIRSSLRRSVVLAQLHPSRQLEASFEVSLILSKYFVALLTVSQLTVILVPSDEQLLLRLVGELGSVEISLMPRGVTIFL